MALNLQKLSHRPALFVRLLESTHPLPQLESDISSLLITPLRIAPCPYLSSIPPVHIMPFGPI